MQSLKDLVDSSRDSSRAEGALNSADGSVVPSYQFGDATGEGRYPNASEYSDNNTDVGNKVPDKRTVRILGEKAIRGAISEPIDSALETIGNSYEDITNVVDPILEKFIFNSDFVLDQTKLHAMNRLSGKVFNPVGIVAGITSESPDENALMQLVSQTVSDIVGGGLFKTTDGKTFYSVADADAQSDVFSLEGFKRSTEGGGIGSAFLREAISTVAEGVGIDVPTRSILAQVVAYNNDLFEDIDSTGRSNWFSTGEDHEYTMGTKLNPIGVDAINYLYGSELEVKDPVKYYKLTQEIRRGLLAQHVMVPKPDDILKEENKQLSKEDKRSALQRFVDNRIGLDSPKDYWKNTSDRYAPDENDLTDQLLEFYFKDFVDGYDKNTAPADFLENSLKEHFRGLEITDFEHIFDIESDRLEKVRTYKSNGQQRPTDSQKLQSLNDTEGFVDVEDHKDGYKYHNIQFKLGSRFRDSIKDRSFTELRNLINDEVSSYNDPINNSDIFNTYEEGEFDDNNMFMAIEDVRTDKTIYLRPTFENISEDIQINNGDFFYVGRTEPFPNYENTTRSITLSFKMYADTPNEFLIMWKKMNFLNSLAYPRATSTDNFKTIQNPLMKFTVGNIFKRTGGYLNTLNYVYSNSDVMWETENGITAPKMVDVSMSFTVLHDEMPFVDYQNNFQFGGENQFNMYDVDYSPLNEE